MKIENAGIAMKTWNKEQIMNGLRKKGLRFSDFSLTHEGDYTVEDADWNYKDVPHLNHIHHLVDATYAVMKDDLIATLNVQNVLGFRLPLSVVNYQSGKNEQTYFTTFFIFVLIVRTHYEELGPCKTKVVTTYHVGYPRFLKWCFPIIRFLIKRNYKNLMSGDIPMRERRGQLRKWGYSFYKDGETYSFPKTMEILKDNVIPPLAASFRMQLDINKVLPEEGLYFTGRADHVGLRLERRHDKLYLFSRTCLHEGASLDQEKCSPEMKLKCPWHGRVHTPLAIIALDQPGSQRLDAGRFDVEFNGSILTVIEKETLLRQCV